MGHVSNWFHDHNWHDNFHGRDAARSKDTLRTGWGVVLTEALVAALLIIAIMLLFPNTVY
jgi:hypothetical protein